MHSFRVFLISALLLLCSLNLYSTDYTFINQSTGQYTGDFYTGRAESNVQSASRTIQGLLCSYYVAMGDAAEPGTHYTDRYVLYDVKTTSTKVIVYVHNTSGSTRSVKLGEIKEGNGNFETIREKSIAANAGDTLIYNTTNTTNSTIYVTVGYVKVHLYQIVAQETGNDLLKAGEGGYVLDFNKGRAACRASSYTTIIDGIIISNPSSSYYPANSTYLSIASNAVTTSNISFTTPTTPGKLILTWSGGQMAYNTVASASGATNITSGSEYTLAANTQYYLINTSGSTSSHITNLEFASDVCSAPTSVNITSATNKYLSGQDITLTASPVGGTGTPHYQWQKKINGTWTNVTNGGKISGATSANLTITDCGYGNAGGYRCIVTRGSSCETKSHADNTDGWGVHVFSICGAYDGDSWTQNDIVWTSGTTGTATIHLAASRTYMFKVYSNHNLYYGNGANNYIIQPINWDCGTGNSNMRLLTGPEGDYTFTVNIEHGLDGSPYVNLQVNYPEVTHPSTGYMYITKWWNHCFLHYWDASNNPLSPWGYDPELNSDRYTNICGTDYWYFPVIETYVNLIAKNQAGDPTDNKTTGNQTSSSHGGMYITHDGSWGWHDFNTYTITFNAGSGTGSMSPITGICPNGTETLTANEFTKSGYTFDGWNTAPDGSGADYADEATISSINSNITLYAQWEEYVGGCETLAQGAATSGPTFGQIVGTVTAHNSDNSIKTDYTNSTADYTYLSSGQYVKLQPKAGSSFTVGDRITVIVHNRADYDIISGFVIGTDTCRSYMDADETKTFTYFLTAANIAGGEVRVNRVNGEGAIASITIEHCTPSTIVDIPGTVNKGNVYTYSADMTWYGTNNDYFDFGPTDAPNTDRWAEWTIRIEYPDIFTIKEIYSCENGHYVTMDLMDGNTVLSTFTGENIGSAPDETERQYTTTWDLRGIDAGIYTLRVRNTYEWSRPKVKSITFTGTIIPGTITITAIKVKDAVSYVGGAYGTITNTDISTHPAIPEGTTITDNGDNTLTINTATPITITAPLTTEGILTDIPEYYTPLSCVWRFDHWENVPTTGITSSVYIRAVYFPTFNVEYDTKGGTINEDPYPTWYRYTGDANDYQLLPIDVTKPGFAFAGWYQHATTELFTRLEGNYYGDYAGVWCLKAHWVLPCDEAQIISKVVLTGQNTYTVFGYNENEYAGTPVVSVGSTTASYDFGTGIGTQTGYELSSTNDIFFATLEKGEFRVGDTIIVAITAVNTIRVASSTTNILSLYYGNDDSDAQLLVNIRNVTSPGVYKYPLSSDDVLAMNEANATGVGVFRESVNGENPCVYSIEIHGCRDLIFDDNHGTGVWNDPLNWGPTYVEIPSYYQATRIIRPCIVNIADAHALNAKLCKGNGNNGSLTINADAALEVTQRVSVVQGSDYNTLLPVPAEDLVIKSNASNQGALAHGDEGSNTHATIEFYARGAGYLGGGNPTWQYVGVPFSDVTNAMEHYYGSEMCRWIENTTGNAGTNWSYVAKTGELVIPFQGYALTNPSAKTFTNQGTLVPSTNQTLTLTCAGTTGYAGWNMFANSWMAPINIAQFEDGDFGDNVQKTVYLMNTGINEGNQASTSAQTSDAGQYVAVPISSAGSMLEENRYVAPMQGFFFVTEAASTVTLRYDLVRNPSHGALTTGPNRVLRRSADENESQMPRIIMDVTGNRFSDRLYVFENANQTNAYDNGWDGYKFEGEDYAPQLMTRTGDLDLAVDVSPAFDGKQIAFRAGEDTEYTLHFSTTESGLALRDLVTDVVTPIEDGGTYHFFASNRESAIRFVIGDNRQVPTGFDEQPVLTSDQILSLAVYTADGRLVLRRTSDFDDPLLLPQSGVYIFYMQTTAGVKIQKITF